MWLDFFSDLIYIEFALVIFTVVLAFAIKWFIRKQRLAYENELGKIKAYVEQCIQENSMLDTAMFKNSWNNIKLLISTLTHFDTNESENSYWWEIRPSFLKNQLLPLARKYASTKIRATNRLLAARIFSYIAEKQDEDLIVGLMYDQIRTIAIETKFSALQMPTEKVINAFIDSVALTRHDAYELYLPIFEKLPESAYAIVLDRIEKEENPTKRALCYCILMHSEESHPLALAHQDIASGDLELALTAIDYIEKSEGKQAENDFIKLLSHKKSAIRSAALHVLLNIEATDAIPQISTALNDTTSSVRRMASYVLKHLGKSGIAILETVAQDRKHIANREATLILNDQSPEIME